MTNARLTLTREQILAHRRRVGALDEQLATGADSLRRAAWAGLQDSMPRAALLSIHARVAGTDATAWEHPSLVQVWGPRYSTYVIPAEDRAVFTLGRLSDARSGRERAETIADRLDAFLEGRRVGDAEAGRALGINPNALRYAAPTGRVLIRWDGARQPTVWTVPAPEVDPRAARLELARRYLHVFGPTTPAAFVTWAGIAEAAGPPAFEGLAGDLVEVETPIGGAWILATDEPGFRDAGGSTDVVRLLPSGDTYTLLQGADRSLLVPDATDRAALWTPRVWPGAVLAGGEVVGTWRRAGALVTVETWRPLSPAERVAIEDEAARLPLPGVERSIRVRWGA
jgi:hypothetical protein